MVVGVAAGADADDRSFHLDDVALLVLGQKTNNLAVLHDELAPEGVEAGLGAQTLGLGAEALHEVAAGAGIVTLVVHVPNLRAPMAMESAKTMPWPSSQSMISFIWPK